VRRKVIIDTDPGTDDAIALMMALSSPDLDVLALTTVGGNAALRHTTRNALRVLEYMGREDIPVYKGGSRPLKGRFTYGYYYHGPAGLTVRLPLPAGRPRPEAATDYIIRKTRENPGEVTLVALGPLTNVARALQREPGLARWTRELVVMGGAIEVPGNVTPFAEFNIFNDPEAAQAVFSSGIPTTLVGLDVCDDVFLTLRDKQWTLGKSRAETLARRLTDSWFASHPDEARYSLCDPLAVMALLPDDPMTYRQATVHVETGSSGQRGKTTGTYGSGNVRLAESVRAAAAKRAIGVILGS
jgi:purine nucleosidase